MAGRSAGFRHSEDTRKKIKAKQLINRLHKCAMGENKMDSVQVKAATALLNKVLPNLKATELTGSVDGNVSIQIVKSFDAVPEDDASQTS